MLPPIYATLQASSAVTAIVDAPYSRIYRHDDAPQDTTRPYITWHLVTGTPENELSGVPGIDRCTVQIDAWHGTDAGVEALATAVRDAIEPAAHMLGIVVNRREPATRLYHLGMQFDWFLTR